MTNREPRTPPVPILLVPKDGLKTLDTLLAVRQAHDITGTIYAVDFYVDSAERWEPAPGGWRHPTHPIVNVDHHAPHASMQRKVSSANLALDLIHADTKPDPGDAVVISHIDCDSILSAGILSGRLDAKAVYGEAAIAADHTGVEHGIADLLQGLDAHWSRKKRDTPTLETIEYLFACLERLEDGEAVEKVDDFARDSIEGRKKSRAQAEGIARTRMEANRNVYFAQLTQDEGPIEGELFLPHLPDAWIVATASPHSDHDNRWQWRIRLGNAAPGWLSLHDLGMGTFDPVFGGRWNAGSNNRPPEKDGDRALPGSTLSPEEYRDRLVEALDARLLEHA